MRSSTTRMDRLPTGAGSYTSAPAMSVNMESVPLVSCPAEPPAHARCESYSTPVSHHLCCRSRSFECVASHQRSAPASPRHQRWLVLQPDSPTCPSLQLQGGAWQWQEPCLDRQAHSASAYCTEPNTASVRLRTIPSPRPDHPGRWLSVRPAARC